MKYSDREKRILAQMHRAGFTDREISQDIGRSITSVESQRSRLGLVRTKTEIEAAKLVVAEPAAPKPASLDVFVARLFAVHPEGYQDGPVKQVRRVHYQAVTGLPILQSCMA